MTTDRFSLKRLGAEIAHEQARVLAHREPASTDGVLAGVARRKKRAATRKRVVASACVMFSVALLVLGAWFVNGRQTAAVASRPAALSVPSVAAPPLGPQSAEHASVPLRFADGTLIIVQRGARVDLREVRSHGAVIRLDEGALAVNVVHTDESQWDVIAGPFDVRVTGTRFDASWDPLSKTLTVAMREGTVHVTGPCVDVPLAAPESRTFACDEHANGTAEKARAKAPEAARPQSTNGSTTHVGDFTGAAVKMTTSTSKVDAALDRESPSVLIGLADASRLAGDPTRATRIYERIRGRFPNTAESAKSTFVLGRMVEDRSPDEAARWYRIAMGEGAYAQEAHGRLMELEQRRGNLAEARALAIAYLAKYLVGPHRAYAQSIEATQP